jgi:pimeloyl-ACP methyl ester carboxylesterase
MRPSRSRNRPRSRRRTPRARGRSCSCTAVVAPHQLGSLSQALREGGVRALPPGWPDDPDIVAEAREHPEVMAKKSIKDVADHYDEVIRGLKKKPAVVGHSFGGLMTEILAGRGLSKVSVAISPAPFRGGLPLPISAPRSGSPMLRNPGNRNRAVPLTFEQLQHSFANAVNEDEAQQLYDTFSALPGGRRQPEPVDGRQGRYEEPEARPLLIISLGTGPHGPLAGIERILQAREAQRRGDGDREDPRPWPRAEDRWRVARGRRCRTGVHQEARLSPGSRARGIPSGADEPLASV